MLPSDPPPRPSNLYPGGTRPGDKRMDQQRLLDVAEYGERNYKDALKFWGMDTTLYDTLFKSLLEEETIATHRENVPYAGAFNEGSPNEIFINPDYDDKAYTEDEIIAHELGHFFKKHKFESIDWDHKLLDILFKPFGGYWRAHADTTGWKDVTSDKFDEMFFPIAEKLKEGEFDKYKQRAKKLKSIGVKLPESLDY